VLFRSLSGTLCQQPVAPLKLSLSHTLTDLKKKNKKGILRMTGMATEMK
jgi:hypothetical protein